MKFVILGGYGGMGKVCAIDLFETNKKAEIIIVGRDKSKAEQFVKTFKSSRVKAAKVDVGNVNETAKLLQDCDVVINCVQYDYNLHVMKAALKAKCNYLDLGGLFHYTKKQVKLNNSFKKIKKVAVLGCGSTPGITNVMVSYGAKFLDKIEEIHISFADKDYTNYGMSFVTPYSPSTLIDEFSLKPALFTKGKLKFVQPMSGFKEISFPKPVDKIKGFYSLHSELYSLPLNYKRLGLKECSFRVTFPDEMIKKMKFLLKNKKRNEMVNILNKFIPDSKIKVNDLEYLKVEMRGIKDKIKKKVDIYCLTKTYKKYNIPSGSYDTGVPPSIIAQMIAKKQIKEFGTIFPEKINNKVFFSELKKRGIIILLEFSN